MLDTLTSFVTVMLALSVASERLVELTKGFSPSLSGKRADAGDERRRLLSIHWLSLLASVIVVALSEAYIEKALGLQLGLPQAAAFVILASGGSSMWNSLLTYLLGLKDLKQQEVSAGKKAGNTDLSKSLPATMPKL